MDARFIQERISTLCMSKGISEYTLSTALGLNKSYINKITRGKSLPSMSVFLQICDYFDITPMEFFNAGNSEPCGVSELIKVADKLSREQLGLLTAVAKEMREV